MQSVLLLEDAQFPAILFLCMSRTMDIMNRGWLAYSLRILILLCLPIPGIMRHKEPGPVRPGKMAQPEAL